MKGTSYFKPDPDSVRRHMRLWTLHPQYLDSRGLVALWREALLAQKVLSGATHGYRHHPQLSRFRAQPQPMAAIAAYLHGIADEAAHRGYRFSKSKVGNIPVPAQGLTIEATKGQLLFEWQHLRKKLQNRSPVTAMKYKAIEVPLAHPLFRITAGPVAEWERGQ